MDELSEKGILREFVAVVAIVTLVADIANVAETAGEI
jgi:hypothetical protein